MIYFRSDLEIYRHVVYLLRRLFDVESDAFHTNLQIYKKCQSWLWNRDLPNRSRITNTHGVGRILCDRNLYTHYQLVWYKTEI